MLQLLRRQAFWVYVGIVTAAGMAVVIVGFRSTWRAEIGDNLGAFIALSGLLLVGEMRPVRLLRLPKLPEEPVAPATTFVFALLLVFGLPAAFLMQTIASLSDDLVKRKPWFKVIFNLGQYALSQGAAVAVLELGGRPFADGNFRLSDIPVTLAAGAAYFVVNNVLIGAVLALFTHEPVRPAVVSFLRSEAPMESLLLGMGPLAATIAVASPILLPLLLLPSVTIYVSSRSILEMERRARTDSLTQLVNRQGFRSDVDDLLDGRAATGVVLLLDLDRFKYVNDTLGHAVGDHLLAEVASRLASQVEADVVGRLGGDEFVLFRSGPATTDDALAFAAATLTVLAQPFEVDHLELAIEASAGAAIAPAHGTTANDLLQRADVALYVAKSSPEQTFVYDSERDQHSRRRLRLLGELRSAIAEDQMVLHFQPQADLRTGEVTGLEALLRWEHPELGLIAPEEFVPQAEHSALIGPLTQWVLNAAVAEARRQLDQRRLIRMSVNVSPRALHDLSLPVDIAGILQQNGLPAGFLTLEVTESAVADLGPASKVLRALATMGISVAVDDFGTGYASMTYLKRLPVSELKIDRSFVTGLTLGGVDAAIVQSTIQLASNLNLISVAEGVETQSDADALRALGCTRAQGYLIARPMAVVELDDWLRDRVDAIPST